MSPPVAPGAVGVCPNVNPVEAGAVVAAGWPKPNPPAEGAVVCPNGRVVAAGAVAGWPSENPPVVVVIGVAV